MQFHRESPPPLTRLLTLLTLLTLWAYPTLSPAQSVVPPGAAALVCAYNASPPAITTSNFAYVQCDSAGKLLTSGASSGNVVGPASSTTGDLSIFADTTGKLLSDSGILASTLITGTKSGNTTVFGTTSGTLTSTHCVSIDASGNLVDSGAACGTTTAGANPTATAGATAVNGVATTYLRSDGAPAIAKASNSVFGIAECDNVTITCPGGVFTSSGGTALTPAPISANWYAAMLPGPTATGTPSASTVYCTPFSVAQSTTIKALGVNVSTNDVGKFVGVAVYNNSASRPSTLVDFVATLTLAGTGALSGTVSHTTDVLAAGVYWACATTSSAATAGFYAPSGITNVSFGIVGATTLTSAIGATGTSPTVSCSAASTCGGSFAAWSGSTFTWFTFSATWLLTSTGLGVAFQVN